MIKKFFHLIPIPLVREFPFFIFFLLLMGCGTLCGMIRGYMHTPDAYPPLLTICKNIMALFLFGYFAAAIIAWSGKTWIRNVFYLFILLLYSFQEFLKANFNWTITPAVITMMVETNGRESSEFLRTFIFAPPSLRLYLSVTAILLSIVCIESLYRRIRKSKWGINHKIEFANIILLPLILMGIYSLSNYRNLSDNSESIENLTDYMEESGMVSPLTRMIYSLGILSKSGDSMNEFISVTKDAKNIKIRADHPDSLTLVFIVGESYIKWHSHLYGYSFHTTPFMDAEKENGNLLVFNDVITPYNHTSESMKNMFSCNSMGDGESWYSTPFFPSLFKKAGYDVFFWDNQRNVNSMFDTWSFTLDAFLYNKEIVDMSYTATNINTFPFDNELVEDFRCNKSEHNSPFKLVIFHLMGQHLLAGERFPHISDFQVFKPDSIKRMESWLTKEKKGLIADYDNATLYNDFVLHNIMDCFSNENAILVYLSDHGEEIYDYRDACGRNHTPLLTDELLKYQFEIPFYVWFSDKYKKNNKKRLEALQQASSRPLMADNVCQLLLWLGYIETPIYKAERNVASPIYHCPKRMVRGITDYDQFVNISK